MKRTPIKRTAFKKTSSKTRTSKGLFDHLKKETKNEEWKRVKKDTLDPFFIKHGLYYKCELGLSMCIGSILELQYAHSKKREEIALEEPERTRELCEVIRVCATCHEYIEYLPEYEGKSGKTQMYEIVIKAVSKRK